VDDIPGPGVVICVQNNADVYLRKLGDPNDLDPPSVLSVKAPSDRSTVSIVFGEPVLKTSAENVNHYSISGGITVNGAVLAADQKTVALNTSQLSARTSYTLTLNNIQDKAAAANTIPKDYQRTFYLQAVGISNLVITDGDPYAWDNLDQGMPAYIDQHGFFDQVPEKYRGMQYLLTAKGDKKTSGTLLHVSFDVDMDVNVFVVHDDRIGTKPLWMNPFTDTGDDIIINGTKFSVYSRTYPKGAVKLGGNQGTDGTAMYNLMVAPANDLSVSRPVPTQAVLDFHVYPNPFNQVVKIAVSYQLSAVSNFSLKIFDINGKIVAKGLSWDASSHPPGIYFATMQMGRKQITKKLILSR
jgi:hypothetical protein